MHKRTGTRGKAERRMVRYALDYSALDRGWATQGAADYCEVNGHATHRVDGVDTGICPRCLTVTERYNVNREEIMTTNHEFQAGEYSPRAGRRVCAVCNETQGSKFHSVHNGNGDEIFHGVTAEGEVFGIEVTDTPVADVEDQGYSEWIDLIESEVYVNAEARVHRDFSSQSGVQGFVGVHKGQKTSGREDVRECAGCEDSENAPHASDCTRGCGTRYGYDIEGKPVVCDLSVGHTGSHLDRTHSAPAQFYWESV